MRQMVAELRSTHLEVTLRVNVKNVEQKLRQRIAIKRELIWLNAGFQLKRVGQNFLVASVVPLTPAALSGVQPGWLVMAVNGRPISNDWNNFVGFREGQSINYKFIDAARTEHALDIDSAFYITPIIRQSEFVGDNIAYIKFDTFDRGTGAWVRSQIEKFHSVRSIIIDLRENTGGLVTETKSALSNFFREPVEYGTFVERRGTFKEQKIVPAGRRAFPGKVFVLVGYETSSAAEIFAEIMQENRRAIVIGGRTNGAVLNSLDVELSDEIELRLPFRDYFSPKGFRLEGRGVTPDLSVDYTIQDFRRTADPVLKAALRLSDKESY
jgi:carboxyl-terminal processing protease